MSEHMHNKGPQDVGGETGEAIDTIDHGMAFWEKQANGLRSVHRLTRRPPATVTRSATVW